MIELDLSRECNLGSDLQLFSEYNIEIPRCSTIFCICIMIILVAFIVGLHEFEKQVFVSLHSQFKEPMVTIVWSLRENVPSRT